MAGLKDMRLGDKKLKILKREVKAAPQKPEKYDPSMEPTVTEPWPPGVDPTPGGAGKWGPATTPFISRGDVIPDQSQPYGYLGGGRWAPRMPDMNPNTGFYSYDEVYPAEKFPQEETVPLAKGKSKKTIGKNIREMKSAGYPTKQAVAASLETARRSGAKIPKKAKRRDTIA